MAEDMGQNFDAVVMGGGFYGVAIAGYLARRRGLRRVALLESGHGLCTRASYANQARVHNGYHYPRSFTTAYRSRVNFPGFLAAWPDAVVRDFTAIYAIARQNSRTTAYQFTRFCRDIGAPIHPAPREILQLFDAHLVENAYVVEECAFDANRLAAWATRSLAEAGVEVRLGTRATSIHRAGGGLQVACRGDRGDELLACGLAFNCT